MAKVQAIDRQKDGRDSILDFFTPLDLSILDPIRHIASTECTILRGCSSIIKIFIIASHLLLQNVGRLQQL